MMIKKRKSFVVYTDNTEIFLLTDAEAGILIKSLLEYVISGSLPDTESRLVMLIFQKMRTEIDAHEEHSGAVASRRREAAQKRWREAAQKTEQKETGNRPEEKRAVEQKAKPSKTRRFVKPTVEMMREYISEKGYNLDAQTIYDHYEAVGWKYGKGHQPIKDWKAAIRTWNNNEKKHENRKDSRNADARDAELIERGYRIVAGYRNGEDSEVG